MRLLMILLLAVTTASAQLAVGVSPIKTTGQKAIISLAMTNNFSEKIESARAAVFLLDENGKRLGMETRWVIGGTADKPGLESSATNIFHFVVTADKPFTTTNLTSQIIFSRIVLEGGKLADPAKQVTISQPRK